MRLKECIRKNGLQIEVDTLKRWQSVDIDFINADGREDETQFDVKAVCTRSGIDELEKLYRDFCRENRFPENTVQSVTVVKNANSLEKL